MPLKQITLDDLEALLEGGAVGGVDLVVLVRQGAVDADSRDSDTDLPKPDKSPHRSCCGYQLLVHLQAVVASTPLIIAAAASGAPHSKRLFTTSWATSKWPTKCRALTGLHRRLSLIPLTSACGAGATAAT